MQKVKQRERSVRVREEELEGKQRVVMEKAEGEW